MKKINENILEIENWIELQEFLFKERMRIWIDSDQTMRIGELMMQRTNLQQVFNDWEENHLTMKTIL